MNGSSWMRLSTAPTLLIAVIGQVLMLNQHLLLIEMYVTPENIADDQHNNNNTTSHKGRLMGLTGWTPMYIAWP